MRSVLGTGLLVTAVLLAAAGSASAEGDFKIIGGGGGGSSAEQAAMLKKLQETVGATAAGSTGGGDGDGPDIKVPKKAYSAEDMLKMGYKTRTVPPPKDSNETEHDRGMRKAFALNDDDAKVRCGRQRTTRVRPARHPPRGATDAFRPLLPLPLLLLLLLPREGGRVAPGWGQRVRGGREQAGPAALCSVPVQGAP